jgi:hypothetical protein
VPRQELKLWSVAKIADTSEMRRFESAFRSRLFPDLMYQSVADGGRYFLHEYVQCRVGALPGNEEPFAAGA